MTALAVAAAVVTPWWAGSWAGSWVGWVPAGGGSALVAGLGGGRGAAMSPWSASPSALVCVLAAACAVALLVAAPPRAVGGPGPAGARPDGARPDGARPDGSRGAPTWWTRTWPAGAALVLVLLTSGRVLVLALLGLLVLLGGRALRRARATRAGARATGQRVLELCEHLAADLGAGQPPGAALDRAAVEWPVLAPVAEAQRIGSDVPAAWRAAAERPGGQDLRLVAAAWQLTHRTGAGLADVVGRVAVDLRAAQATRRVVDGELASARATARLVAALPLVALAMGSGAGGDPWGFLLGRPLGLACLAAGLALGFAGLWWIEAIARGVEVDR